MYGDRIKSERKRAGLTQAELAKRLELKQQTVGDYERGIRKPSFDVLEKMSKLFGCTIDYLFGRTNVRRQLTLKGDDLPKVLKDAGVDVYMLTEEAAKNGALSEDELIDLMQVLSDALSKSRRK